MHPQTGRLCLRCGEDLGIREFSTANHSQDTGKYFPDLCRPCESAPPAFKRAVAYGTYDGTMRSLIHLLKYERMQPIAGALARRLAPLVAHMASEAGGPLLVIPVPLHSTRLSERGFNQATLLASATVRAVRRLEPMLDLQMAAGVLMRRRATESQAGLSTHQRRRNLRGAFFVAEKSRPRLAGRKVLLMDDIYTTGATARACSRVLQNAGAESVWVATVARAQREGAVYWDGNMSAQHTFPAPVTSGKTRSGWASVLQT